MEVFWDFTALSGVFQLIRLELNILKENWNYSFRKQRKSCAKFRFVCLFICAAVLRASLPNGVMLSVVSLPNHTFTQWGHVARGQFT